jgi:hypothetical protein
VSQYALGVKVDFEGDLHKRILDSVKRRWMLSRNRMSDRYTAWSEAEDKFVAYMPATDNDKTREGLKKQGKPQYTTLEIPYSYAQLLSAHTYWTSVFLSRTPIFQFTGRHGESEDSVQAVEAVIDYQVTVGKMLMPFYIWLLDVGKYGLGIIGNYWDREVAYVTQMVEQPRTYMGIAIPGTSQKVRQTREVTSYLGNKIFNIRPFDWFPDPRVPISQFQKGEFCGRYVEVGWNNVKQSAANNIYQNFDRLKGTKPGSWLKELGSSQLQLPNRLQGQDIIASGTPATSPEEDKLDFVSLMEMCVELIPSEWELGNSNKPEKWMFTIGNDAVVLRAAPLGCLHNQFPFVIIEYEMEGYGLFKRGLMETLRPMNDVMTWLFNTHFHNVRKVLNDQLVVDPSRVVMKDVTDPNAGRIIRLRPEAYGSPAGDAIHQLQVVDITRSHLTDIGGVAEMMQRLSGVTDNIMGMVNQGGRKTATEVRTSSAFGINRLKTNTEYFSAGGFAPLSQMMLQNTQQYYDQGFKFRIAGELMTRAQTFVQVDPEALAGFYDFVPVDGTMPVDRYALANLWKELLAGMRTLPSLMMQYDLGAIFGYVAQLAGVRNLQQFKLQVTPDEVLRAQVAAGNSVPLGGGNGQPGKSGNAPRPAGPRQVPGVGPLA